MEFRRGLGQASPATLLHAHLSSKANYPSQLSPFPLNPPLDVSHCASACALIRLVCLPTELKLVYLQRAKQGAHGQCEGDSHCTGGTWSRVATREPALQCCRGAAWSGYGPGRARGPGGGRGQGPAQCALHGHICPLTAACRTAAHH